MKHSKEAVLFYFADLSFPLGLLLIKKENVSFTYMQFSIIRQVTLKGILDEKHCNPILKIAPPPHLKEVWNC